MDNHSIYRYFFKYQAMNNYDRSYHISHYMVSLFIVPSHPILSLPIPKFPSVLLIRKPTRLGVSSQPCLHDRLVTIAVCMLLSTVLLPLQYYQYKYQQHCDDYWCFILVTTIAVNVLPSWCPFLADATVTVMVANLILLFPTVVLF